MEASLFTTVCLLTQEEKVLLLMPDRCLPNPVPTDDLQWITTNGGRRGLHTITLEYRHYSTHAVLSAVLPEDVEDVPSSFELVGHIAHFNLRKEVLPYRALIGMLRALEHFLWN